MNADDDEHLAIVRVEMTERTVALQAPFEPLSPRQACVVSIMQSILRDAFVQGA